ncbi:MAG: hypothetical protein Q9221_008034 [Calogaya cf. arnoldii]
MRSWQVSSSSLLTLFASVNTTFTVILVLLINGLATRIGGILPQYTSLALGWPLASVNRLLALKALVSAASLFALPFMRRHFLEPRFREGSGGAVAIDLLITQISLVANTIGIVGLGFSSGWVTLFVVSICVFTSGAGLADSLISFGTHTLDKGEMVADFYVRTGLVNALAALIGAFPSLLTKSLHLLPFTILSSTRWEGHTGSSGYTPSPLAKRLNREMAYGIMGSTRNSFLSTYQTTRPVKCLYFDGASGALGEHGTMDTQMLFLYGNTTGPPAGRSGAEFLWNEYARAQHLCGTSSFTRHSNQRERALSAIDPGPHDDLPAPDWEIDWEHEPFVASQQWDWFTSTSRTYSSQDLASVREPSITLLDADSDETKHFNLTPNGYWRDSGSRESRRKAMPRLMRRRARHRLGNISPQEVDILRSNVKQMMARVVNRTTHGAQGRNAISWSHTSDMIIENYARRLMHLQRLLGEGSDGDHESQASLHKSFTMLRERAHALLMPFFEYPFSPETAVESQEVQVSFDRCKRQYLPASMYKGASETLCTELPSRYDIGQAFEEVMDNICSVLIDTGLSIEKTWLLKFNQGAPILNKKQHQILRIKYEHAMTVSKS